MSDRYPGGIISATAPEPVGPTDGEGGSAPGVWTMEQASYYEGVGQWPKPILPRELYAWGASSTGQLGQNNTVSASSPTQIGGTIWKEAAVGAGYCLATKTDYSLWSWGAGSQGKLGHSSTVNVSSPVQIGALTTWLDKAAGQYHSLAVKTDGTLWAWGGNGDGQLGLGDKVLRSSPVQVGSLTTWSKVSTGVYNGYALKTDGTIWAWGWNPFGQLGQNNIVYASSPVQVGSLTTWADIVGGQIHVIAVKTDGTMWTWGADAKGSLGQNTLLAHKSSPVQVGALTTWNKVGAGDSYCLTIKNDNTLWTWGDNGFGQLGQNTPIAADRSSPVQVGALTDWSKMAPGAIGVKVIKTDGTLWSWGYNTNGELGQNSTPNVSSPVQVGSGTNWSTVAKGAVGGGAQPSLATTKG